MHLDFIVPGFSKCGTTTLCSLLNEHPEIYIPKVKEFNFFAWKWELGWDWYEAFFEPGANQAFHGEGSQGYASAEYAEVSAMRIKEHFPNVKLIFLARNPISRLASSFREMHHNGHIYNVYPSYSIGAALRELPNMIHDTLYWKCISVFRRQFSEDQIHVAFSEDFVKDPGATVRDCFQFLGVDPSANVPNLNRNLNSASEKLYDTRLMRFIRTDPVRNKIWNSISSTTRTRIERKLGLRKPFRGKVTWDHETLEYVRECVEADAREFLEFYGKPADFWSFESPARKTSAPLAA